MNKEQTQQKTASPANGDTAAQWKENPDNFYRLRDATADLASLF
jgi:hypothetical protein